MPHKWTRGLPLAARKIKVFSIKWSLLKEGWVSLFCGDGSFFFVHESPLFPVRGFWEFLFSFLIYFSSIFTSFLTTTTNPPQRCSGHILQPKLTGPMFDGVFLFIWFRFPNAIGVFTTLWCRKSKQGQIIKQSVADSYAHLSHNKEPLKKHR